MPLVPAAQLILDTVRPLATGDDPFIFPGGRALRPLSNMAMASVLKRMQRGDITVHGMRSAFRDWAAECTSFPNEVVEMALAHAVGNKVEAAYRSGDLCDKRRQLINAWARYCAGEAPALRGVDGGALGR